MEDAGESQEALFCSQQFQLPTEQHNSDIDLLQQQDRENHDDVMLLPKLPPGSVDSSSGTGNEVAGHDPAAETQETEAAAALFALQQVVNVQARTGRGENKPGGQGIITHVCAKSDGSFIYSVRYTVEGGSEKEVAEHFISSVTAQAQQGPQRSTRGRCKLLGCNSFVIHCNHIQPGEDGWFEDVPEEEARQLLEAQTAPPKRQRKRPRPQAVPRSPSRSSSSSSGSDADLPVEVVAALRRRARAARKRAEAAAGAVTDSCSSDSSSHSGRRAPAAAAAAAATAAAAAPPSYDSDTELWNVLYGDAPVQTAAPTAAAASHKGKQRKRSKKRRPVREAERDTDAEADAAAAAAAAAVPVRGSAKRSQRERSAAVEVDSDSSDTASSAAAAAAAAGRKLQRHATDPAKQQQQLEHLEVVLHAVQSVHLPHIQQGLSRLTARVAALQAPGAAASLRFTERVERATAQFVALDDYHLQHLVRGGQDVLNRAFRKTRKMALEARSDAAFEVIKSTYDELVRLDNALYALREQCSSSESSSGSDADCGSSSSSELDVLRSSSPADAADDYYGENDAAEASDYAAGLSSANMQPQPLGGTKRQRSLSAGSHSSSSSLQRQSKRAASTELLRSISSSSTGSSSGAGGPTLEPAAAAAAAAAAITVAGRVPRAQSDGSSSARPGVLIPFHEKHARKLARAAARAAAGHSVRRRSSSSGKRGKQQLQQLRSGSTAEGSSSRSAGATGSRTVSSSGRSGASAGAGGQLPRSSSSSSAVMPASAVALADDSATEMDDDGYSSSSSVNSTDGLLSADDVAAAEAGSSRRHDRPMQQRRGVRQPAAVPAIAAAAAAARVDSLVEDLLQCSDLLVWGQQRYTLLGLDSNTAATAPASVCTAMQEHRYCCACDTEVADADSSAGHSAHCHLALLRQLLNSVSLWSEHCSDAPNVQAHSELAAVSELIGLLLGSTLGATAATAGVRAVAEECVAAVCAALHSLNILGGLRDAWHAADSDADAAQHSGGSSSSSTAHSQALLQLYTALACHTLDWADRSATACRTLTAASSAGALECCATLTSSLLLLLLELWPFERAVWHSAAPQQRAQVRAALPLLPLWLKLMRVCDSIAESCTTTAMPAAGGSAAAALCKGGFWGLLRAVFTQRGLAELIMPAEMCWRVLLEALRMSLLSPTGSTTSSTSSSANSSCSSEQWQCVAALLQASAAAPTVAATTTAAAAAAAAAVVQATAQRQLPPGYACVLFKRVLLLHRCWRTVPDPALKASLWATAQSTAVAAAAAAETAITVGLRHGIVHSDADDALLIRALRGAVRQGGELQQQSAWGKVISRAVHACCLAAQLPYCLPAAALTGM
jgi:hypothetical protein